MAEMIGELGRKYILFGISAIWVGAGIGEVDNEKGGRHPSPNSGA
jgi:hypothetical protein